MHALKAHQTGVTPIDLAKDNTATKCSLLQHHSSFCVRRAFTRYRSSTKTTLLHTPLHWEFKDISVNEAAQCAVTFPTIYTVIYLRSNSSVFFSDEPRQIEITTTNTPSSMQTQQPHNLNSTCTSHPRPEL